MAAVYLLLFCATLSVGEAVDLTREPGTSGANVVQATVAQIQQSGVFPDDRSLLRRVAYVASKDGADAKTYRSGYHGGIWQVDNSRFLSSKSIYSNPAQTLRYRLIKNVFNIDWNAVQWIDLRKPLYSAIATSLLFSDTNTPIPPASDVRAQAVYVIQSVRLITDVSVQSFINDVSTLESQEGI